MTWLVQLNSLDPLQFAYRSTDDAIALTLHTALSHLDQRNTYVRMLFIDYSSTFNTIVPSKLAVELQDLGLNTALCDWILRFLKGRPQAVRIGNATSSPWTLITGAPQGCVLSPLLYSLFIHDCVATHSSNTIVKFAEWRHNRHRPDHRWRRDGVQRRGQYPDILVPEQQPPSQPQKNQGPDCGLQEATGSRERPPSPSTGRQ